MEKVIKMCQSVGRIVEGVAVGLVLIATLYFVSSPASAIQNIDAILQAGTVQFTNNGAVQWSATTNQGNNITWQNNGQSPANITTPITFDGATGAVLFGKYTKAQVDALVPGFVGEAIIVTGGTTSPKICLSTGTAADQWSTYGSVKSDTGCGTAN